MIRVAHFGDGYITQEHQYAFTYTLIALVACFFNIVLL